ncbi:hypothetical protein WJX72_010402 [[Myrmecia] bisecta]|uniref:Uncharacterized protein n=1 Tax=[Myrmecia] bisecta TaxID=41462 RepID=A0AAW1QBB8_9CHLO
MAGDSGKVPDKPAGIWGRLTGRLGGKPSPKKDDEGKGHYKKASLGKKNAFYYDEELKCWREKGKDIKPEDLPPPPPPIFSTSSSMRGSARGSQDGSEGGSGLATDGDSDAVLGHGRSWSAGSLDSAGGPPLGGGSHFSQVAPPSGGSGSQFRARNLRGGGASRRYADPGFFGGGGSGGSGKGEAGSAPISPFVSPSKPPLAPNAKVAMFVPSPIEAAKARAAQDQDRDQDQDQPAQVSGVPGLSANPQLFNPGQPASFSPSQQSSATAASQQEQEGDHSTSFTSQAVPPAGTSPRATKSPRDSSAALALAAGDAAGPAKKPRTSRSLQPSLDQALDQGQQSSLYADLRPASAQRAAFGDASQPEPNAGDAAVAEDDTDMQQEQEQSGWDVSDTGLGYSADIGNMSLGQMHDSGQIGTEPVTRDYDNADMGTSYGGDAEGGGSYAAMDLGQGGYAYDAGQPGGEALGDASGEAAAGPYGGYTWEQVHQWADYYRAEGYSEEDTQAWIRSIIPDYDAVLQQQQQAGWYEGQADVGAVPEAAVPAEPAEDAAAALGARDMETQGQQRLGEAITQPPPGFSEGLSGTEAALLAAEHSTASPAGASPHSKVSSPLQLAPITAAYRSSHASPASSPYASPRSALASPKHADQEEEAFPRRRSATLPKSGSLSDWLQAPRAKSGKLTGPLPWEMIEEEDEETDSTPRTRSASVSPKAAAAADQPPERPTQSAPTVVAAATEARFTVRTHAQQWALEDVNEGDSGSPLARNFAGWKASRSQPTTPAAGAGRVVGTEGTPHLVDYPASDAERASPKQPQAQQPALEDSESGIQGEPSAQDDDLEVTVADRPTEPQQAAEPGYYDSGDGTGDGQYYDNDAPMPDGSAGYGYGADQAGTADGTDYGAQQYGANDEAYYGNGGAYVSQPGDYGYHYPAGGYTDANGQWHGVADHAVYQDRPADYDLPRSGHSQEGAEWDREGYQPMVKEPYAQQYGEPPAEGADEFLDAAQHAQQAQHGVAVAAHGWDDGAEVPHVVHEPDSTQYPEDQYSAGDDGSAQDAAQQAGSRGEQPQWQLNEPVKGQLSTASLADAFGPTEGGHAVEPAAMASQEQLHALEHRLLEAHADNQQLQGRLHELEAQLGALRDSVALLTRENEALAEEGLAKDDEIDTLTGQLAHARRDQQQQQQHERSPKANGDSTGMSASPKADLGSDGIGGFGSAEWAAEFDALSAELAQLRAQLEAQAGREAEDQLAEQAAQQAQHSALQQQLGERESELAALKQQLVEVRRKSDAKQLRKKLANEVSKREALEAELAALHSQPATGNADHEAELADLRDQVAKFKDQQALDFERIGQLAEQCEQLQEQQLDSRGAEEAEGATTTEQHAQQAELAEAAQKLAESTARQQEAEGKLAASEAELDTMWARISALEDEATAAEGAIARLQGERKQLTVKLVAADRRRPRRGGGAAEAEALQAALAEQQQEFGDLLVCLGQESAKVGALQELLEEQGVDVAELLAQMTANPLAAAALDDMDGFEGDWAI